jgi:hypothetical protein
VAGEKKELTTISSCKPLTIIDQKAVTVTIPSAHGTMAPFSVETNTVNTEVSLIETVDLTLKIRFNSSPVSIVEKLFIDTEIVFALRAYRTCAFQCSRVNPELLTPIGSRMFGSNCIPMAMLEISSG